MKLWPQREFRTRVPSSEGGHSRRQCATWALPCWLRGRRAFTVASRRCAWRRRVRRPRRPLAACSLRRLDQPAIQSQTRAKDSDGDHGPSRGCDLCTGRSHSPESLGRPVPRREQVMRFKRKAGTDSRSPRSIETSRIRRGGARDANVRALRRAGMSSPSSSHPAGGPAWLTGEETMCRPRAYPAAVPTASLGFAARKAGKSVPVPRESARMMSTPFMST